MEIDTSKLYSDIQEIVPKFETFGDNLFWSWANWQTMWQFGRMPEKAFGRTYYMVRQRHFKKYQSGEQHIHDLYEMNKSKLRMGDYCCYCGEEVPKEELTADHVFPRVKGGTNDLNNIIFVCKHCNSSKGKKDLIRWFLVDKGEFPSPFLLGHYLRQVHIYAQENGLMAIPFLEVEKMDLPFEPRSILLLLTARAHHWYYDNWIRDDGKQKVPPEEGQ